ncbi:DUF255 domain-containing protein [Poriferisphaera sp. WC338]|uniref:DUF255 domain-containing protein n=1 Tax=Poriferisphaera sp. WC338 TaxID=3425129 RepID=UPI003D8157D0
MASEKVNGEWKYTNRLARETSPYLLQHAHNPVDWHPWGEAAFAKARDEGKLIFLSIGYSTCYWCHVMEREVFEYPELAAVMNEKFVCVKVDREERPDVDEVYMMATQLLTGSGGWPMSVFLTPPPLNSVVSNEKASHGASNSNRWLDDDGSGYGLKPIFAGTYFGAKSGHGRPGFGEVMEAINEAWMNRREEVLGSAVKITGAVRMNLESKGEEGPLDVGMAEKAREVLLKSYDEVHGGFGRGEGPKFPQPVNLMFLMAMEGNRGGKDAKIQEAIKHTLDRMARGGMYDQVGGGFHRYSVDGQWLVPHFEKMLYDNGQLLRAYAKAYELSDDDNNKKEYARVMRETVGYLLREMKDSGGTFYSAQDAEVDGKEGENYVWTESQVREAMMVAGEGEEMVRFALEMYGLDRGSNFRDPHDPKAKPVNVLFLPTDLDEVAFKHGLDGYEVAVEKWARVNDVLKEARDERKQPRLDDKVIVSWNGLAIKGLADAGRVLNDTEMIDAAAVAAGEILEKMMKDDGGLVRTMREGVVKGEGQLEDYAMLIRGLLAVHRTGHADGSRLVESAEVLAGYVQEHFAVKGGGYFNVKDVSESGEDLLVRIRSATDGAMPSGNSEMVLGLLDLYRVTGEKGYAKRAVKDLRSWSEGLDRYGVGMLGMCEALVRAEQELPETQRRRLELDVVVKSNQNNELVEKKVIWDVRQPKGTSGLVWEIVLKIAEGYHVNVHDVTSSSSNEVGGAGAMLVPTDIWIAEDEEMGWGMQTRYPEGVTRTFAFSNEAVEVYEGEVVIGVKLVREGGNDGGNLPKIVLQYQVCSDDHCLAPVKEKIELK